MSGIHNNRNKNNYSNNRMLFRKSTAAAATYATIFALFMLAQLCPLNEASIVRHQQPVLHKRQFPPSSAPMPWTVQPEHLCARENGGADNGAHGKGQKLQQRQQQPPQQCNIHNRLFQCACPPPNAINEGGGKQGKLRSTIEHSCPAVLPPVDAAGDQLLTIGLAFPLVEQFLEDPERVFLEDLELFTFIPREAIVIYRRGCAPDQSAYEFQFGILESTCRHVPPKLRTVHPRIFLSNPFFMYENALKVAYIRVGGKR